MGDVVEQPDAAIVMTAVAASKTDRAALVFRVPAVANKRII